MFITFLSDFGLQDDFVGTCHGVIKRIAPEVNVLNVEDSKTLAETMEALKKV